MFFSVIVGFVVIRIALRVVVEIAGPAVVFTSFTTYLANHDLFHLRRGNAHHAAAPTR